MFLHCIQHRYNRTSLSFRSLQSLKFKSLGAMVFLYNNSSSLAASKASVPSVITIRIRGKEESDVVVLKSRPGCVWYLTILNISSSQFPLSDRSL